jgi:hypothetical protein
VFVNLLTLVLHPRRRDGLSLRARRLPRTGCHRRVLHRQLIPSAVLARHGVQADDDEEDEDAAREEGGRGGEHGDGPDRRRLRPYC